jgi:hypothetical protein
MKINKDRVYDEDATKPSNGERKSNRLKTVRQQTIAFLKIMGEFVQKSGISGGRRDSGE